MRRDERTLTQIEAFHAAATSTSMAAAARRLGLTRAAVSRSIKMLERSLGVPLFRGVGRRRRLTETAEALLPHAASAVEAWQALRTMCGEMERPAKPPVSVGRARSPHPRGLRSTTTGRPAAALA